MLAGTNGDDLIQGLAGSDTLRGNGGADTLNGDSLADLTIGLITQGGHTLGAGDFVL